MILTESSKAEILFLGTIISQASVFESSKILLIIFASLSSIAPLSCPSLTMANISSSVTLTSSFFLPPPNMPVRSAANALAGTAKGAKMTVEILQNLYKVLRTERWKALPSINGNITTMAASSTSTANHMSIISQNNSGLEILVLISCSDLNNKGKKIKTENPPFIIKKRYQPIR
ncbi:MAG: hypothetical protein BWY61_00544 [Firmicutes bacterium ADurb.Bin354]|nr:MAG: hypothetical protein BWY61_00544 [Firmicutes bacterium ADurb.Bin354]